ncbi:transcriptional regulator, PaaX family [Sulfitobacter marinus]|uniref:Transcriptional regulator, PaaX family n=1 Tax=Sulfitobacter marinus TaxID=394264 RepID=A0A1I6SZA0_9RHOB|nr:PaaX family transcriptional regulator C-terminal domain-containing protein [Sulfitobacter marinus]SFS82208.1 transcriptional regulator, PaaX family [Sulfitobacter marinus]
MLTDDFAHAASALKKLGGQRVWSLMISLFGDLARREGDVIDGPVLSTIMAAMDVRPEAARVALHRLRKDNWIASEKQGRISLHSLTPDGRAQADDASARIYTPPDDLCQNWQMLLLKSADAGGLDLDGFTQVDARVFVGPTDIATPKDAYVTVGADAPAWLQAELEPQTLTESYTQLHTALVHAVQHLPAPDALTPLEIATLRCLIVHNWRRLALKHPALPKPLIRKDWVGFKAHVLVADLLARYPRPDPTQIATA